MKKSWIALLAGSAAAAAVLFAPAAHARTDASIHVQIGTPVYGGAYYGAPHGGYYGAQVYTAPAYGYYGAPRYVAPPAYGYGHGHGYRSARRDQDRDGIPNRWDRDRDGDGVPNRWDRRDRNPYRY